MVNKHPLNLSQPWPPLATMYMVHIVVCSNIFEVLCLGCQHMHSKYNIEETLAK